VSYDITYVQAMKNTIIDDLFTRTADENYVTARWCATNGLETDFFWLAVHALEKYMKAALLRNGRSAKDYNHEILKLHNEINKIAEDLLPAELEKPDGLSIAYWRTKSLRNFLEYLYENGNAHNRYLIFGFVQHIENLHMLDQTVFAFRRLICPLDDKVIPGGPTFTHRDQLRKNPRYRGAAGADMPLERLIQSKQHTPLRHAALNLNLSFAPPGYPHTEMSGSLSAHSPMLATRILDPLASQNGDIAALGLELGTWVLQNMPLPSEVRQQIRDAMAAARKRHATLPN
jgi:hypothetical protein